MHELQLLCVSMDHVKPLLRLDKLKNFGYISKINACNVSLFIAGNHVKVISTALSELPFCCESAHFQGRKYSF